MSATTNTVAPTRLGLIGGSSFLESSYLKNFAVEEVSTPFGAVRLRLNASRTIVFVQRHAADPNPQHEYSPPHLINYKAIIKALQQLEVSHVIAFGSTGSLKKTIPCGSLLVPDDWIHFSPVSTFDYAKGGHVGTGLDQDIRAELLNLLRGAGYSPLNSGVYAQTLGPRFETPAEIRSLAIQGGDIVGMTCAHEATLCRELSLPYALICIVDNMANGIAGTEISYEEFHAGVKRNLATMEKILGLVIEKFTPQGITSKDLANATHVDSIVHARWIVPIVPANAVYENHAIITKDGVIVEILPSEEARKKYKATNEETFPADVLMPGLINAHSHLGMSLMRGYADDHCLSDWLVHHIWPGERVFVSEEFVHDSCELGLAEMIRGGTTACNDMYWFPEVFTKIADRVGIRALIGLILIDFPTAYASGPEEYLKKGLALYEAQKNHPRISFALAPHAPYTVSDENLSKVRQLSQEVVKKNNVPARVHIHLHETKSEVVDSSSLTPSMACHRSTHKCRPFENLDSNIHLMDENLIAVHMTQLTTQEIQRLAQTKSNVVHCATSNLKLASGLCPVANLQAAGVNVALGTDSTASNNGLDMFAELKLAAILAKQVAEDPTVVPAFQALQMATLNGAKALGMEKVTGSLEAGKSADFIVVHMDELEAVPLFSVISHLAYVTSREHVTNVWVAGKRLMRDRNLLTLDEKSIRARARKWQQVMKLEKDKQAAEAAAAKVAAASSAMDTSSDAASANGKKRAAPNGEVPDATKPKH